MEEKNIKLNAVKKDRTIVVDVPEGYSVDTENSSDKKITLKKDFTAWRCQNSLFEGKQILADGIASGRSTDHDKHCLFSSVEYATAALAMARISQIIKNDSRFGGDITTEEWENFEIPKYVLENRQGKIRICKREIGRQFLAFHTPEQCKLFLLENKDLVCAYLMTDIFHGIDDASFCA